MPTPRTDALNEELHGRYYAHAFGGPYDTMLSHAEELEAALTAAESRASRAEKERDDARAESASRLHTIEVLRGPEPVRASDLQIRGQQFGVRFIDGCGPSKCVELYSEDDDNWFLQSMFSAAWLDDLAHVIDAARGKE